MTCVDRLTALIGADSSSRQEVVTKADAEKLVAQSGNLRSERVSRQEKLRDLPLKSRRS
jgi:hypothetical protein